MSTLYDDAASVLEDVLNKKASLKALCFHRNSEQKRIKNPKMIFAVVTRTLPYYDGLVHAIKKTTLFRTNKNQSKKTKVSSDHRLCMLVLMVRDLLFGGKISGGGALKKAIMAQEAQLKKFYNVKKEQKAIEEKKKNGEEANSDNVNEQGISDESPHRVGRVNTLVSSMPSVIKKLTAAGATNIERNPFVETMISFDYTGSLPELEPVKNRALIIQSLSSGMPAAVLAPSSGASVIDACAAPGNKTSQLAAIMANKGHIFAFDRDKQRCETMAQLMTASKASCVEPINGDFLKTDPNDPKFKDVEFILCDPSCSGSGITNRVPMKLDTEAQADRLKKLSSFQYSIVNHALSFPNVKRVTYSTCSVHQEENEDVVARLLKDNPNWKLGKALPKWERRGLMTILESGNETGLNGEDAAKLVRVNPELDHTTGFFVALFVRKGKAQKRARDEASASTTENDTEAIHAVPTKKGKK